MSSLDELYVKHPKLFRFVFGPICPECGCTMELNLGSGYACPKCERKEK